MAQLVLSLGDDSQFCRDPEGLGPISQLRELDLTLCFEQISESDLLIVFCLFAGVRCTQLFKRERRAETAAGKTLLSGKLTVGVLPLITLSFASLVLELIRHRTSIASAPVLNAFATFAAFVIFGILTHLNHTRTRRSSTILLTFWPLYLLQQAITLRTRVLLGLAAEPVFGIRCALFGVGLISWALECFCPDRAKDDPNLEPEEKEFPYERANIYSCLTFSWMSPLMKLGYSRYITEDDMTSLSPGDAAHALSDKLQQYWMRQLDSRNPSLWCALFRAYGRPYAIAAAIKLVRDVLSFAEPQLLRLLLVFVAQYQVGQERSALKGWALAGAMFMAGAMQTALMHQHFQICMVTGMRVRAGLITAIYNKALAQASDSRGVRGDIVNLMSVDATRLQDFCTNGLIAISGPLQIVLAFVSLYNLLGWPAFTGVGVMVISLPLHTYIARVLKGMQGKQMKIRGKAGCFPRITGNACGDPECRI